LQPPAWIVEILKYIKGKRHGIRVEGEGGGGIDGEEEGGDKEEWEGG
jgi:hypothetical protein